MSAKDCIEAVTKAAGRDLSEGELDRILTETQARMNARRAAGDSTRDAAARAGADLAAETRLAAQIAKRNAAENVLVRQGLDARVREGAEADALREATDGKEGNRRGAALSARAIGQGYQGKFTGQLFDELRQSGLLKTVEGRSKAFERDVARDLWRINDPAAPASGNKFAEQVAQIIHRAQETARLTQNEAGAWIRKLDHYITRQSHDAAKILKAGFDRWYEDILPRLDDRTFEHLGKPEDVKPFLLETYNSLSTGVHNTAQSSEWLTGFKGSPNLAKKVSQERVLHFKDSDAWFDYNALYGRGAVIDSVINGLEGAGRNVGVMKVFGTNPEAMFKSWKEGLVVQARARADGAMVKRLESAWEERILDVVTGKANIAGQATVASMGSTWRNAQSLSKMGGVLLSSITDLPSNAALARHNGVPLLDAYANQLTALLPRSAAGREVSDVLGAGYDGMKGSVLARFHSEDGVPGAMSKAVQTFYKWNGLSGWTDHQKAGVADMLTYGLAKRAGQEHAALPPQLQATMRRYGIEAGEWNALRGAAQKVADGRTHLLPSAIASLPDEAFAGLNHVAGAGGARREVEMKFQTYISDQIGEGMNEPTAAVRAIVTGGVDGGTAWGQAIRLFTQFKAFPISYTTRTLNREFTRGIELRGGQFTGEAGSGFLSRSGAVASNTARGIAANPSGVAHMIVSMTAMGYLVLTLKDFAKGRSPRDPDDAGGYAKLVGASMMQGGGLGLFGDFLLGEANRFGGGVLSTFAGPTYGNIDELDKLFKAMRDGGTSKKDRMDTLKSSAFDFAKSNTPFINLFYARAAIDHYVLHGLQEMMNPGYLRRMEQRAKKENNQTYWLRPTEAVRY